MSPPINNMMVELLRSGKATGIAGLFTLGVVSDVFSELDFVSGRMDPITGERMEVTRRSVWSWVHEAADPGGVEVCWGRLGAELDKLPMRARAERLQTALGMAVKGALIGQQVAPLGVTWECMLGYTLDGGLWSRTAMLSVLETFCRSHASQSMLVLQGMNDFGHVVRPDLVAWLNQPSSLMDVALEQGQPDLIEFLAHATDLVGKKAQWQATAERSLVKLLSLGQAGFEAERERGSNAVAAFAALLAFAPHVEVPVSAALTEAYATAQSSWTAIPSLLREQILSASLPQAPAPKSSRLRF